LNNSRIVGQKEVQDRTFRGGSIIKAVLSAGVCTKSNIPSAAPVTNLVFRTPFASALSLANLTLSSDISIPVTLSNPPEQVMLKSPEPQYASTRYLGALLSCSARAANEEWIWVRA
jgi:hypothetical protein